MCRCEILRGDLPAIVTMAIVATDGGIKASSAVGFVPGVSLGMMGEKCPRPRRVVVWTHEAGRAVPVVVPDRVGV
jgi:hypothetical protein